MSALITTGVVAVLTAFLGMASYLYQKRTDHQVELSKQQREAYDLYMQSYHDWTLTTKGSDEEKKADDKYWRAYYALFPLASDGFLRAAMAYHSYMKEAPYPNFADKAAREKFKDLWTTLVIEMRNDANVKSHLSTNEIEEHIPYYFDSYESMQGGNADTGATPSSQQRDA
jgi:hypothetical protein